MKRKRINPNLICSSEDYNKTHKVYLEKQENKSNFVSRILTPNIFMMRKSSNTKTEEPFNIEEYGKGIEKRIAEFRKGKQH